MANIDIFRDADRPFRSMMPSSFFSDSPLFPSRSMLSDFDPFFRDFDRMLQTLRSRWMDDFRPMAVDVHETEKEYILSYDIPGMKREDLNIDLQGDRLVISGERKSEISESDRDTQRMERQYRRVYQSFTLPEDIDTEKIEASYEDGVLYLALPKTEVSERKRIQLSDSKKGGILERLRSSRKSAEKH